MKIATPDMKSWLRPCYTITSYTCGGNQSISTPVFQMDGINKPTKVGGKKVMKQAIIFILDSQWKRQWENRWGQDFKPTSQIATRQYPTNYFYICTPCRCWCLISMNTMSVLISCISCSSPVNLLFIEKMQFYYNKWTNKSVKFRPAAVIERHPFFSIM